MEEIQQPVVADLFANHLDTQREIYAIETKKTRNKLFLLAGVVLVSDIIGLAMMDALVPLTILIVCVVPVIFVGLAFLSTKEPLLAIVAAAIIIAGIWIYTFIQVGPESILSGWIVKVLIVYSLISGLQNAKEAQRAKKEMAGQV